MNLTQVDILRCLLPRHRGFLAGARKVILRKPHDLFERPAEAGHDLLATEPVAVAPPHVVGPVLRPTAQLNSDAMAEIANGSAKTTAAMPKPSSGLPPRYRRSLLIM